MVNTVLNFTIKADTSQMTGEVKRAGSALNDLGGAASSLVTKFEVTESNANRVAKSLGLELSSAAERTVAKLEGLRDHLIRTGAPAADLERTTLALAEADKKYAASLSNTTQKMSVWAEHGTAIAATAGVMATALFGFGVVAVKAFSESEAVLADLDAVLESTGDTSVETKQQILGLAESLSKVTQFSDETIIRGETILKMFTNIGQDVFPRATKATLDLAQRMGMDVPAAAKLLGKALDQPGEGFTALARQTGKFTDAQVAAIKEMAALGKTGEAQAMVLDLVEKKVGGAAEAFGKTLPGGIAIARNEADEFNESIGMHLVPILKDLVAEFPNVTVASVGLFDSWKNLGISGGELLIAMPLLKTAFGSAGLATALGVAGQAAAALGTAWAAWEIGRMVGEIEIFGTSIDSLAESFFSMTVFASKNIDIMGDNAKATEQSRQVTDSLEKEVKALGLTVERGSDIQEHYNGRLMEAIKAHKGLEVAQSSSDKVAKSHVLTLQQQIDKQRALVESYKHQTDKSEELTQETAKLDAMLKKASEGTKKVHDEMKKLETQYASTTGKIALEIAAIQEDIKFMEQHRGSTEAMSVAKEKLGQKTFELIAIQAKHPELLKKIEIAHQEVTVHLLGERSAVELLTAAYDRYLATIEAFAAIDLDSVMISNNATLDEAFKRVEEGTQSWEKLNEMIKIKTPEALAPAKQSFEDFGKQISTISTDLSKGLADALIRWQGFGAAMKKTGQEFGSAITRTFLESMMEPLTKEGGLIDRLGEKMSEIFEKVGAKIKDFFGKLFDSIESFMGTTIGRIMGAVTGAGIALAGYKSGNKAMGAAGGALLGAELGSFFGPWGTAIGAGLGAAGGWIAGMFGARGKAKKTATGGAEDLSKKVWESIIPDVRAGNLSIDEGIAAVNAAWASYERFLRENLKDQTVIQRSLDTQRVTLTQSLAELEAMRLQAKAFDEAKIDALVSEGIKGMQGFLDEIAKTGVVTDEAIKGLQAISEVMAGTGREAETSASKLAVLGAEFFKTGQMTDEFASALEAAGGSADFFTKLTGEVQRLQGLRSELGALKNMVDSFIPKQKTWMENFMETGEITDDMAEKIREAGGDIQQFQKFAQMKGIKTQFEGLVAEFNKTGVASEALLGIIMQYGDESTLGAFKDLIAQAKDSGKSLGELAKDSDTSAKAIQAAFDSTSTGINKAFGDAAKQLSDALTKMDENLGKAIQSLQNAMVTMIKDLIDVLLGVPGAAEKAAQDANFFLSGIKSTEVTLTVVSRFNSAGIDEAERRSRQLAAITGDTQRAFDDFARRVGAAPGSVTNADDAERARRAGETTNGTGDRGMVFGFATGTDYVPRTGLALLHQGEAVIPANENNKTTGGGNVTIQFMGNVVANNPEQLMDEMERYLATNREGARVRILKALRLKQSGAF